MDPNNMNHYAPYFNSPYAPYNPMLNHQQRLQAIEQANPHLIQQYPQQKQETAPFLKGRAVVGVDEAKASQIDFDGSVHVFTDIGNERIYTKQIGLNGIAEFRIYVLHREEGSAKIDPYDTQEEINKLHKKIDDLEVKIEDMGGVKNAQSNASNSNDRNATKQRKPTDNATTNGAK